jgi:hypothetical protein
MSFREWLLSEGGRGSGTKFTSTGLNAGGQAQSGMTFRMSIKPAKPFVPRVKTKIRPWKSSI